MQNVLECIAKYTKMYRKIYRNVSQNKLVDVKGYTSLGGGNRINKRNYKYAVS